MSVKSIWPQIVGQAWADETFRDRLIADPKGTLAECGITLSDGQEVEILTDTPEKTYLVLPAKPLDLDELAGPIIFASKGGPEPGQCTGDEHKHKRRHHHHDPDEHPQCTKGPDQEPGTCTCREYPAEPGTCTCREEPGTCTCRQHPPHEPYKK
jgi:hypothetical protein